MKPKHRSRHRAIASLLGSALSLFVLLLTITACFPVLPPFPFSPTATASIPITGTVQPEGTPQPPFVDSELWLSQPSAMVSYPALRIITETIPLRDFASSWIAPDIEAIAQLAADPVAFKVALIRMYNPEITTVLSPNENIVVPQFSGEFTLLQELAERIRSPKAESEMLSAAAESYIHAVIFLNPIKKSCFEEYMGVTLESIKDFNPNLLTIEDDVIPVRTILFIPRRNVTSAADRGLGNSDCIVRRKE